MSGAIYGDISEAAYHGDDLGEGKPSLSASIARILIGKSPAHARAAHPLLNPDLKREESMKFDFGQAAHKLFLEGEDAIAVCVADDWRTKDAKMFREEQRSIGKIPLLVEQAGDMRSMVSALRAQVEQHRAQPALFADGKPEQTLVWEEANGVICRARLDWLRDDFTAIDDLKTTTASADPVKWERTMYGMGCDVQVAFYMRGVETLTGVRPVFRYVVVETYPPYAMSVVGLAPSALALAEAKVDCAISLWAECLASDSWPGYTEQVASIEVPTYEEMRWLDREQQEQAA